MGSSTCQTQFEIPCPPDQDGPCHEAAWHGLDNPRHLTYLSPDGELVRAGLSPLGQALPESVDLNIRWATTPATLILTTRNCLPPG
jgi:hypothetical protein